MSQTRKQRRESAAKAARTAPVAIPVTAVDKLRVAYSHIEDVEFQNDRLHLQIERQQEDYLDLEQKADSKIAALKGQAYRIAAVSGFLGVVVGCLLHPAL